jgi:glutamyl-Q tRNA(Asp) synthetase
MPDYIGRFAPSPSGALHLGSLIAATASYLDAKANKGKWLLRIDDLDTPRVVKTAIPRILKQLEDYGLEWDQAVFYPSQSIQRYHDALQHLFDLNQAFYCDCTRQQIQTRTGDLIYDGFCKTKPLNYSAEKAIRYKLADTENLAYQDLIQGMQILNPITQLGDFIIKRRDGIIGYHLACAIDDLEQGITHVIRGYDLIESSFAQRLITQQLANKTLFYGHHPIALSSQNIKLSKSAQSLAIEKQDAVQNLYYVLKFLNQQPDADLQTASLNEIWYWAITHWNRQAIPALGQIKL